MAALGRDSQHIIIHGPQSFRFFGQIIGVIPNSELSIYFFIVYEEEEDCCCFSFDKQTEF